MSGSEGSTLVFTTLIRCQLCILHNKRFVRSLVVNAEEFRRVRNDYLTTVLQDGPLFILDIMCSALFFSNRLNIWRLYVQRYMRYTPLLAASLLFLITLMKHIVFGSLSYLKRLVSRDQLWKVVVDDAVTCPELCQPKWDLHVTLTHGKNRGQ